MKRILSAAVLCLSVGLVVSACDDNSPGAPPTGGGSNIPNPTFRATLSPANEVPPVTNAEASASGTMDITIVATRDSAGNIIAAGVNFNGTVTGFPAGSTVNIAHIHPGVAGSNGSILVNTGLVPGEVSLSGGSGTIVKNGIAITTDVANQIIANPSAFYFNVHTALNPPGALRGQLVRTN
jgi:hypothetical protein